MAGEMRELAQTPLGRAIDEGDAKVVTSLIQRGENVLAKDRKGNTYLHYVCTMYRPGVINVLIAAGVDLNHTNKYGNTALHVTALQNEPCHVTDLMAASIRTDITNWEGETAKDIGSQSTIWIDLYRKYEPTLREAIRKHDLDRVVYLLNAWSACHLIQNGKDVRQYAASLTHHDIVKLVDKARFSIGAVYAILERDYSQLSYCLSRGSECNVNFMQQLSGSAPRHMLQLAIKLQDVKMVDMLMEAGVDVNITVNINDYFRGPLYFAAINFEENFDRRITQRIMAGNIDMTARDERGRSALIYLIDRRNGHVTKEFVQLLLKEGINIAMRDETGCTARNVAALARRKDIVSIIDKHLIDLVKTSDVDALWELVMQGYDDVIVTYHHRDTWIYAAGNESRDVEIFLNQIDEYTSLANKALLAVKSGNLAELEDIIAHYSQPERLLMFQDKAGRGLLLNALLFRHTHLVQWLIQRLPSLVVTDVDNTGRTVLHYIFASDGNTDQLLQLMLQNGAHYKTDCAGLNPQQFKTKYPQFLEDEQNRSYGLEREIHCMKQYEELLAIIRSKRKSLIHFENALKQVQYPLQDFPKLFMPDNVTLVPRYRCLLLAAIDEKRVDIATRLVNIKLDCSRQEQYQTEDGHVVWQCAPERASILGLHQLADYIYRKGNFVNRQKAVASS